MAERKNKNPYVGTEHEEKNGMIITKVIYTKKNKGKVKKENQFVRIKIDGYSTSGDRKSWFKTIKEVDLSKKDGYAFIGNFLTPDKEYDLKEGTIIIEKRPEGSVKHYSYSAHIYVVENQDIILKKSYNDWYKDFLSFRDEVARMSKIKNPSTTFKAQKMFEDFNHYPAEKIVNLKLPINSKTVFAKLGEIENLEYLSDKKIFASDQKTSKRKIRTYIHSFAEHGKRPMLLTNEAGNILILYDPENHIEVKPEGII